MCDKTTSVTNRDWARREIARVAQEILSGSIDLLAGCRSLVRLRIEAEAPVSPAFAAITGVESETDDYPLGDQRAAYGSELLARLDSEISTYLNKVRPDVLEACKEIVEEIEGLTMQCPGNGLQ